MGDWVLLRLRHRPIASLDSSTGKLKPRFFGPYQVTEVINAVAVRVALSARARLHDVFHVGLLKKWQGVPPATPPPLPVIHNGATVPEPERVERSRLARGVRQVLVRWKGEPLSSSTWEDWDTFRERFPAFQLEDERRGEMSCMVIRTPGDVGPATLDARLSAPSAPRARSRRPRSRPVAKGKDRLLGSLELGVISCYDYSQARIYILLYRDIRKEAKIKYLLPLSLLNTKPAVEGHNLTGEDGRRLRTM